MGVELKESELTNTLTAVQSKGIKLSCTVTNKDVRFQTKKLCKKIKKTKYF